MFTARLTPVPQIVPHVTGAIQDWIERVSKIPVDDSGEEPDICIIEVCMILSDWTRSQSV